MDKIGRILKVIEYSKCSSPSAFASLIGYNQSNLSKIINGKRDVNDNLINAINYKWPEINKIWLLTGEGSMLNNKQENAVLNIANEESKGAQLPIKSYSSGVPYYNVDFIGGFDLIINDQTINPEYYIDFKQYNSADCWCNVTGHSMEPEINQGDIIALKELHDWRTYIPAGEIYGLVTTEHRTIKKVCPSPKEGFLRLIPTNKSPEYVPQDIPISIVLRVYKVLGCMKRL